MEGFHLGEASTVRRGTVPSERSPSLELLFGGGAFAGGKVQEGKETDDFDKHAACALAWLQAPSAPEPRSRAPAWAPDGHTAARARLVHVAAPATEVRDSLRHFFAATPSDIAEDESTWTLRGTAFVDFVVVEVEVRIFEGDAQGACTLAFSHTTARDAVRFASLVDQARVFVSGHGQAMSAKPVRPTLMDFGEDDDLFSDDGDDDWSARIDSVLGDASAGRSGAREEAWQTLATWAEQSPACRGRLAEALLAGGAGTALVIGSLRAGSPAPIAELYPMAAAMRLAVLELEGRADALLARHLSTTEHLPKIVAKELREVRRQLLLAGA